MTGRNTREEGAQRDAKVLASIEKFGYITSRQISQLFFEKDIKNPKLAYQKTCYRLTQLCDKRGLCHKMAIPNESTIYSIKKSQYHAKVRHYLAIVDIWIRLKKLLPADCSIYSEVERKQHHDIITDLYVLLYDKKTRIRREYFIEVELNSSGDIKDKIRKYEALAWSRSNENACPCVLAMVTNRRGIYSEIEGYEWEIPVKVYPLSLEGWKW